MTMGRHCYLYVCLMSFVKPEKIPTIQFDHIRVQRFVASVALTLTHFLRSYIQLSLQLLYY